MYDVARRDTFENLDLWLQEVEVYSPAGGRDVVKLLVGNKIDKVRSNCLLLLFSIHLLCERLDGDAMEIVCNHKTNPLTRFERLWCVYNV